ncbi:MAG: flagellar hook capping FlgD N-terminal domain-containing protein, partial [Candidatus Dormibacteraceae bacterium]
ANRRPGMSVPTVSGPGTSGSTDPSIASLTGNGSQLGEQSFLQLLVAQLQNQDPMQPMDDTQFISQLAQFSTLQTMQQIQSSLQSSLGAQLLDHAMSFLGHTVSANDANGSPVSGTVSGIKLQSGNVLLEVGSTTVNLSDVSEVKA